jgi:hypothetical protein
MKKIKTWYQKKNQTLYYNFNSDIDDDYSSICYHCINGKYDEEPNIFHIKTKRDFPLEIIDPSIKILKFNYLFNQNIAELPSHIEEIHFCEGNTTEMMHFSIYNKPINYLPFGIKRLYLGSEFNKKLQNLPESLEYLELKGSFNKSLDHLPNSIKEIRFEQLFGGDGEPIINAFNKPINHLPDELEILDLNVMNFNHPLNKLPKNLKKLKLHLYQYKHNLDNLPENLEDLEISIPQSYPFSLDKLPKNLKNYSIERYRM